MGWGRNCPFYGSLRFRGQILEGRISSVGMARTVTIERDNVLYMKKFERYEKRTSSLSAHLPSCIGGVEVGDRVKVMGAVHSPRRSRSASSRTKGVPTDGPRLAREANPRVANGRTIDGGRQLGAKVVQIISVLRAGSTLRRYPAGGVGDMIRVSVKKGNPETRRQMYDAVIVRQRRPFRRVDGTWVQFEDNAAVITNRKGEVQGSDIKGPVAREARERYPRIAATAKQIV